jgi:hypothetical protein
MSGQWAAQSVLDTKPRPVSPGPATLLCPQLMTTGGIYWEDIHRDEKSGGIAIKITKTADGLYSGTPQQVFAYTLDGAQVWYDLNAVFGEPFFGHRVEIESDAGEAIVWPTGSNPGGSHVQSMSSEGNIFLTIYE